MTLSKKHTQFLRSLATNKKMKLAVELRQLLTPPAQLSELIAPPTPIKPVPVETVAATEPTATPIAIEPEVTSAPLILEVPVVTETQTEAIQTPATLQEAKSSQIDLPPLEAPAAAESPTEIIPAPAKPLIADTLPEHPAISGTALTEENQAVSWIEVNPPNVQDESKGKNITAKKGLLVGLYKGQSLFEFTILGACAGVNIDNNCKFNERVTIDVTGKAGTITIEKNAWPANGITYYMEPATFVGELFKFKLRVIIGQRQPDTWSLFDQYTDSNEILITVEVTLQQTGEVKAVGRAFLSIMKPQQDLQEEPPSDEETSFLRVYRTLFTQYLEAQPKERENIKKQLNNVHPPYAPVTLLNRKAVEKKKETPKLRKYMNNLLYAVINPANQEEVFIVPTFEALTNKKLFAKALSDIKAIFTVEGTGGQPKLRRAVIATIQKKQGIFSLDEEFTVTRRGRLELVATQKTQQPPQEPAAEQRSSEHFIRIYYEAYEQYVEKGDEAQRILFDQYNPITSPAVNREGNLVKSNSKSLWLLKFNSEEFFVVPSFFAVRNGGKIPEQLETFKQIFDMPASRNNLIAFKLLAPARAKESRTRVLRRKFYIVTKKGSIS